MSAQHGEGSEGHGAESQGLINTPKQLITVVVASFLVPIIGMAEVKGVMPAALHGEPGHGDYHGDVVDC